MPALPPSPALTKRVRNVLRNLFELGLEKIDGPQGLVLRSQKRKVNTMIDELEDALACEMANGLLTVADYIRDHKPAALVSIAGGKHAG